MIHTDGRPTAATYRPPHGGYPGSVPAAESPAPRIVAQWNDSRRVDVTFSLPAPGATRRAADAAVQALARHGLGCTLSFAEGYWQGSREDCATVSVVGANPDGEIVRAIVAAVIGEGCVAVQVESWQGTRYSVREVRQHD